MGHRLDFNVIFWMLIGRFDIQQPTSWYVDTLQLQTMSLYIVCVALFTFTEVPNVTRLKMWVFLYGLPWNLNAKALATKFCLHIRCHYGARTQRTPLKRRLVILFRLDKCQQTRLTMLRLCWCNRTLLVNVKISTGSLFHNLKALLRATHNPL